MLIYPIYNKLRWMDSTLKLFLNIINSFFIHLNIIGISSKYREHQHGQSSSLVFFLVLFMPQKIAQVAYILRLQ
jgi:hypothetical protein